MGDEYPTKNCTGGALETRVLHPQLFVDMHTAAEDIQKTFTPGCFKRPSTGKYLTLNLAGYTCQYTTYHTTDCTGTAGTPANMFNGSCSTDWTETNHSMKFSCSADKKKGT